MLKFIDKWGGPETYPHMAAGWAVALDTPYQWTKQVASDPGGTKVGMAIHWPKGIKAKGELRTQFHHVIDVAPTILEAAGLPEPEGGQRRAAAPDGRREHGLQLRRRQGKGTAHHPVLRDVRQPGHLSRRLVRADHPQGALGSQAPPAVWRGYLGAVSTRAPTSAWSTTWRQSTRRSSPR